MLHSHHIAHKQIQLDYFQINYLFGAPAEITLKVVISYNLHCIASVVFVWAKLTPEIVYLQRK